MAVFLLSGLADRVRERGVELLQSQQVFLEVGALETLGRCQHQLLHVHRLPAKLLLQLFQSHLCLLLLAGTVFRRTFDFLLGKHFVLHQLEQQCEVVLAGDACRFLVLQVCSDLLQVTLVQVCCCRVESRLGELETQVQIGGVFVATQVESRRLV